MGAVGAILGEGGRLSRYMPNSEYRPEQVDISAAIHEAIQTGIHSICEAGTGTGKSLAYLIPAIMAINQGKTVVVSTHTIGLQTQILEKDIPIMRNLFPEVNIRAFMLKGRSNYLCKQDLLASDTDVFLTAEPGWKEFRNWANTTLTGDIADLPNRFAGWPEVAAKRDTCRNKRCQWYDSCFFIKSRGSAKQANLIIVNHSLYFASMNIVRQNGEKVIPDHDVVIFDEAHTIEDIASAAFGSTLDSEVVQRLVTRMHKHSKQMGLVGLEELPVLSNDLFSCLYDPNNPAIAGKQEYFLRDICDTDEKYQVATDAAVRLMTKLGEVSSLLDPVAADEGDLGAMAEGYKNMCNQMCSETEQIFAAQTPGFIQWAGVDQKRKGGRQMAPLVTIHHTPVDVANILRPYLFSAIPSVIMTSATLSANNNFGYVKSRLGVTGQPIERIVGSPFDYKNKCMVYIPDLPEPPKGYDPKYTEDVAGHIEEILEATSGRAFVLFTSRAQMDRIYNIVAPKLNRYRVLKQGDAPSGQLIDTFKQGNAVLFGLATFWEGVDVQGEALSCVIIDRIPFAVPDSPIVRARTDAIKRRGGNWFNEYSVPIAMIKMKQGFGRLIRTKDDRGIVAILDTRLVTKNYGNDFHASLPPARKTRKLGKVETFMGAAA